VAQTNNVPHPNADGMIAPGTAAGHPWSAFVTERVSGQVSDVYMEFVESPGTRPIDLAPSPRFEGGITLDITNPSTEIGRPAIGNTGIGGEVARGSARTVRGQLGGQPFAAPVVDPGPAYGYDVYATVLPGVIPAAAVETASAVAYDASGHQVAVCHLARA